MNKPKSFIIGIFAIIITLSIIQVVVSNSLSTTGIELAKLQGEKKALSLQNSILREKLLFSSSYANILQKANSLGFIEEKARFFVSTPLPLAAKP